MSYLGKLMTILWENRCYFFSEETEQIAESAAALKMACQRQAAAAELQVRIVFP
jgi:hypothetical protein